MATMLLQPHQKSELNNVFSHKNIPKAHKTIILDQIQNLPNSIIFDYRIKHQNWFLNLCQKSLATKCKFMSKTVWPQYSFLFPQYFCSQN
jgi:hypothetical protein